MDRHTLQRSFIDDKRPKLRKSPGVECCALRPSSLHPRANVREVFQRNRSLRAFGLRNNPFGETVVDVVGKPALLSGQFSQSAAATACPELLQPVPEPAVAIAHVFDGLAAVRLTVAIGRNICYAQINTECALGFDQCWRLDVAGGEQIPATANKRQIALATLMFKQGARPLTTDKRNRLPAIEGPDRNQRIGECKREDAVIVGDCTVGRKRPLRLPIQRVGICDFGDTAHRELCGQVERFAHRLIGQCVDGELAERLRRKSNLTDVVARGVCCLKRAPERIGLFRCRVQFQLDGQFHLAALLLLNVVLGRFRRNVPGAADRVRTTPQRRQARKRIAQHAGGIAFEVIGKLLRGKRWRAIHEHMQVIGHDVKRLDGAMQFSCFLKQQFFQTLRNRARQHLAAVLRTPDEVVIDGRDATSNVTIPFSTHVLQHITLFDRRQLMNNVGGRASSARLKPTVSARTFL